ncbi:RNA polymerase sigma-70 factor (ECF subfamily) [Stackebrandtia endophytica]|uniref:RNA polymerase sigma-70 factor (ECF subfamily) n=1 Tax=Stackebrandtia endophytica TaxID=1496996 RepID=A0A543B3Q4_9ACTN|nr:RNA polymerase sigma factor SigJ [Stackebrandtia endophytica]TQL79468.1 RNA polymerase sigma-70 factor (ECF subfamily) [Stackebrandtia endophytica]
MCRSTDEAAVAFEALRPRLLGVAYGLLSSVAEAEDVVQEAWIRLQRTQLDAIEDLTGWLVTTTSRIALDVLRSARARRETYVGPWLPEPVETSPDPADSVGFADSMSWAMLVVLETLAPAERAAFVLHDVFGLSFNEVGSALGRNPAACRKLASRARKHIEDRKPRFDVDPAEHRATVNAFARAAVSGDLSGLLRLLAPDAVLTADGGGVAVAARRPIIGAERIASFLAMTTSGEKGLSTQTTVVNGTPAVLVYEAGKVITVMSLYIHDGLIVTIDAVRNPNKFHGLRHRQITSKTTEGDTT